MIPTIGIRLGVLILGLVISALAQAGDHPRLVMTQNGVEKIRAELGQVPLFRTVEACNWQPLLKKLLDRERICSYDDAFITAWQQPSLSFFRDFAARRQVPYFDPFPHLSQPLVDGVNLYKNVDHLNDRGCLQLTPAVFEFLDQLIIERQQSGNDSGLTQAVRFQKIPEKS